MPKLKKLQFGYYTKKAKDLLTFEVECYVGQDGTFYCSSEPIPVCIKKAFPDQFEYADSFKSDTLGGLCAKINKLLDDYRDLLMDDGKVKVIMYRIALQGDLTPDLGGNEDGSRRHNDFDRECDIGVGLKWDVVWKHKILGRTEYTRMNGMGFGDNYKRKEMVWTEDREKWFEQLENSLRAMLLRIDTFFYGQTVTQLAAMIDSGSVALPAPPKK